MSENLVRALSGLVYIALLIAATLYSAWSFQILFTAFLLLASNEFRKLIQLPLAPTALLSILSVALFYYLQPVDYFIYINSFSAMVLGYLIYDLFLEKKTASKTSISKYLLLFGYIILPLFALIQLPYIEQIYTPEVIIGIFVLIWTNDTFAYIVGKNFGKTKLLERVSPKKTVEGFLGGLVFSILAGYILSRYFVFFNAVIWISSAIFVSFFGTIGDLVESKFKRSAGVKDSGNIMPGHGGILDRLDSLIFVSPFLYLIFKILS